MRRWRWFLVGAAFLGAGFVRQTTDTGAPMAWNESCPLLEIGTLDPQGPQAEQLRTYLSDAIAAWQTAGCDQLPLAVSDTAIDLATVGFDGRNVVVTRPADYCSDLAHADEAFCLQDSVLATTTVFSYDLPGDERDGEVIETDLEINLAHDFTADGSPDAFDLPSVLIHEVGHIIGLDHSCTSVHDERKLDPAGNVVPECSRAGETASSTIMFPRAKLGEVRRSLAEDERRAVCLLYQAQRPRCVREFVAGCACKASHDEPSWILIAFGILVVVTRRRARAGACSNAVARSQCPIGDQAT